MDQVVDLALGRLDHDLGVDQPGRADDLLDGVAADLVELVVARASRRGRSSGRSGRGTPPTCSGRLSIALGSRKPWSTRLRLRDMSPSYMPPICGTATCDSSTTSEVVLGEVVEQAVGRRPVGAAVHVHRVVLDAGARADLPHHLDVVRRAHPQPLRLEQLALALERRELVLELELDAPDRPLHPLRAGDVVGGREDVELLVLGDDLAGDRVQRHQPLDLVAEELDADRVLLVDREDLEGVAADPERAAGEGHVVAGVLDLDEPAQDRVAVVLLAHLQPQHPVDVLLRGAEAVDARDRRHHDHVATGQQRVGRGVPQPLDLLVDRGVLLDVGVGLGDVGLGLVVVVVGDEVLDRVVREQLAQLVGELGGQRLVGLQHQHRPLHLLGHPGDGRGLAGAGRAEQHDVLRPALDALGDLLDRGRLVTGRLVVGDDLEGGHPALEIGHWSHGSSLRATTDSATRR